MPNKYVPIFIYYASARIASVAKQYAEERIAALMMGEMGQTTVLVITRKTWSVPFFLLRKSDRHIASLARLSPRSRR